MKLIAIEKAGFSLNGVKWKQFLNSKIQDVHSFLLKNGFSTISGDNKEVIYQTTAKNKDFRKIIVVEHTNAVITGIYMKVEKPSPDLWKPTILKKKLA